MLLPHGEFLAPLDLAKISSKCRRGLENGPERLLGFTMSVCTFRSRPIFKTAGRPIIGAKSSNVRMGASQRPEDVTVWFSHVFSLDAAVAAGLFTCNLLHTADSFESSDATKTLPFSGSHFLRLLKKR